jgi:glutathione-regulated potassium-efflux system ancillary protein KefF
MICVIYAHPYPNRSHANRVLMRALAEVDELEVRSLYELYPDFDIDVAAEQEALSRARLIVWMHPLYWYNVPALLKHWFDRVLAHGWAYGQGGRAIAGKHCLWAVTTGGDETAYSPQGMHEQPFVNFIAPIEETARFCGMIWEPPFIVHGAHLIDEAVLEEHGRRLVARLIGRNPKIPNLVASSAMPALPHGGQETAP